MKASKAILSGLSWTALATVIIKLLSFISQFLLGFLLEVETYGVFALVASAVVFVTVFQNSGVSKFLISNPEDFSENIGKYSAFNFIFSLIGMLILIALGVFYQFHHDIKGLLFVFIITSAGIPIAALCTIYSSKYSVEYRFKELNLITVVQTTFYYLATILLAYFGMGIFTFAIATTIASFFYLYLLSSYDRNISAKYKLDFYDFVFVLKKLKWVIVTAALSSIALRADYLVLSSLLSIRELGLYYFGFMLVMSVTVLISSGINQALLPVFSKLKGDKKASGIVFLSVSKGICLSSSFLCLGLVTLGPFLVHNIWSGKWDDASVVIVLISLIIPIRMKTALAYVVFESNLQWKKRATFSLVEILTLALFVWTGASHLGLLGACLGTSLQRFFSGVLAYPFACTTLNISIKKYAQFIFTTFTPYIITVFYIFFQNEFSLFTANMGYVYNLLLALSSFVIFSTLTILFNFREIKILIYSISSRMKNV